MQKQTLLSNFSAKKRQLPSSVVTGTTVDYSSKYGQPSSSMRVSSSFTPSKPNDRMPKSEKKQNRGGSYSGEKVSTKQGKPDNVNTNTEKQIEDLSLSGTQKQVLDIVMQRKSVFFTGAAGTGKSYILRILQDVMDRLEKADKIAFTASTGVAACNIRGLTIHSWAGIGRATDSHEMIIAQVRRNSFARARWKDTEILVIDEISMLSGELLDLLSRVGRDVRGDSRPFGGMQVILCGDFFQLPPIGIGNKVHFCFECETWKQLFHGGGMVALDTVFRQKDDATFLNILNEMRTGKVSSQASQVLNNRVRQCNDSSYSTSGDASTKDTIGEVRPTKLFATNKDVDAYNSTEMLRLSQLGGEGPDSVQRYTSIDEGVEPYLQQLKQGTKAPEFLELRIGAQVMLLKNLDTSRGLVNGARGTVIGFEPSKNRSVNYAMLPVVKFNVVLGSAPMEEVTVGIVDDKWDTKLGDRILASRIQLPLMLAWAISIHKSQGMTIPLLEVSFNNIFEFGQGYVALSRATCLAGLTLRSFSPSAIKAHFKVSEFYRALNGQTSSIPSSGTCTTTLEQLASTFIEQLPERPPAADDGWIDTKKSITSGLNAAVQNIVVKEAPLGSGYGQNAYSQYPPSKQVKYEDSAKSCDGVGGDAKSNNPFDGHRYDEWLEAPASSSSGRSSIVKSEPFHERDSSTQPATPQQQTQAQFQLQTQTQTQTQTIPTSGTAQQQGVSSLQRQPVTLGGFFSATPAARSTGSFAPSSSFQKQQQPAGSQWSSFSTGSHKMAPIFSSPVASTPQQQRKSGTNSHSGSSNSSSNYNNNHNNSNSINRLISSQQSSQPLSSGGGGDAGHTPFAVSFNPYAKLATFNQTLQVQQQQREGSIGSGPTALHNVNLSASSGQALTLLNNTSTTTGTGITAGGGGEVRITDLSDDLKRRIEENRQMALQKQRESKQRREEEMQRAMLEHRL